MNKIFNVIWNKHTHTFVVCSELAGRVIGRGRQKISLENKNGWRLFRCSLLVSSLLMAISGSAYAVNEAPPANNIDPDYQAANGLISIAGGGKGNAHATDNNNGQNDEENNDYGIAIGAEAKGFWASVAMGDTAEARSLYGTAIGPKATIDDDSNYAVSLGNQASVKTSHNGVALGGNASLNNAENSVAVGNAASVNGAVNSVALGANSTVSTDNTVSIGNIGSERKLVNMQGGDISKSSTEAVNGSQLFETREQVNKFDGRINDNASNISDLANGKAGLLRLSKNGLTLNVGVPNSTTSRKITGVSEGVIGENSTDAINGSQLFETNAQVEQLGDKTTANTGDIANLTSGKTGLVQLSADGKSITFDPAATDAMVFDLSGRTVTGVKEGKLSADSTEAINGAQLFKTNNQVANLSKDLSTGKAGLVQLSDDGESLVISDTAVTAKKFDVGDRALSGVADGDIAAGSRDAVNGSQLFKTNNLVEINTRDIATNTGDISNLTNGKTGLIQLDTSGKNLIFGSAATNALVFNVGNRTLTGVKAGAVNAGSTDAVNGSQLHDITQRVETNSNDIAELKKNPGEGGSGNNDMLQMSEDGKSLVLGDAAKTATSVDLGNRTMTGVADGELSENSTDAVNGSQLHKTNQQVSKNTTDISKLSNDISSGKAGVAQIDGNKIVFNDGNKGTTTVDVGGRNIANVKEGELSKNSKEVVNGSQLYETNSRVEKNSANIATNTKDIKTNQTNIASNTSKISELESSFSGMNSSFRDLSEKVNKNKKRAEAGIAGAMAMTAIPHVNSDDFSFGMAMSGYQQQGALAAGMTFKTSEHTAMKINSSWDTQHGTGVAAGFAWGW